MTHVTYLLQGHKDWMVSNLQIHTQGTLGSDDYRQLAYMKVVSVKESLGMEQDGMLNGGDDMKLDHGQPSCQPELKNTVTGNHLGACEFPARGRWMKKALGRPRTILEPENLREVTKECPRCSSTNTKFQYFNNNKESQPRYKCGNCSTKFTYYPKVNRKPEDQLPDVQKPDSSIHTETDRPRPSVSSDGMRTKEKTRLLPPDVGPVKCPRCPSLQTRFLYFNNRKLGQPRYRCLECKNTFTHGGKVHEGLREHKETNWRTGEVRQLPDKKLG